MKIFSSGLTLLTAVVLLAGCGSGGSSSSVTSTPGTPSGAAAQGVAVDPYIVGAIFQEVAADGTVLQSQSTASDATGRFQFPGPVTLGSMITSKASSTGTHNGVPYSGILKRQVSGADVTWVVSPLTTLTASGMSDQQVLDLFSSAGLSGLTAADITADPMSGLVGATTITSNTNLVPLQANMAANAFMQALGNYQIDPTVMTDPNNATLWQGMVTAVADIVSQTTYQSLAADPSVATSSAPMTVDDFIRTAANLCQAISNNTRQDMMSNGGSTSMGAMQTIVDNALATAPNVAHQYYAARVGEVTAPDGATLYANNCAGCHLPLASTTKPGRTAAQITAAITSVSTMKSINLTTAEIQSIADALAGVATTPTPTPVTDGATLYANNCAGCHQPLDSTAIPGRTATQITSAIASVSPMQSISLSTDQIQAIADTLAGVATTPTPTPTPVTDGATLYANNCAGCHQPLDSTAIPGRTAAQITAAIASVSSMQSITLTADQIQAIADALAQVNPPVTLDGATLYANNCAGCHQPLDSSAVAGATAAQIEAAIAGNFGGMNSITLTADQIQAIADVLATIQPAPAPTPTPGTIDGAALYASDCAGCHQPLDSTAIPGRTAEQITAAIASVSPMQSISLTADQIQAIADVLPAATSSPPSGPDYSDCTACHGQPPNGSAYPNEAGTHAVHQALAGVGTDCSVCHTGAAHNGTLDISIKTVYNAKSGLAGLNPDGSDTCVNVSCHGGKTTPDWYTGSLNVNADCKSCHASGTGQFNSYNSGKHGTHSGRACKDCHNTNTLAVNHFGRLDTTTMEGPASATIGGGSTRISSYNASTRTCVGCHGTATW